MPKLIDKALMRQVRLLPHCDYCKRENRSHLHPHHIFTRGMGGGTRLDHSYNLAGLCGPGYGYPGCHRLFHDGKIPRAAIMAAVAKRLGVSVERMEKTIARLRR